MMIKRKKKDKENKRKEQKKALHFPPYSIYIFTQTQNSIFFYLYRSLKIVIGIYLILFINNKVAIPHYSTNNKIKNLT